MPLPRGAGAADPLATDVLVVGAGPAGLMLANRLAASGVPCLVVDGKAGPTAESRAVVVQARSMELYDQLGIADRMLAAAATAADLVPGFGRRRFRPVPIGRLGTGTTPFNRLYVLEQSRTEELLYENLRRLGGDVLWHHRLEAAETDARGGVTAVVQGPGDPRTVSARYCAGADGSGSTVRRLRDIPFEGTTDAAEFFVCDAQGVEDLPADSVNVRLAGRGLLLAFPMTGPGHHRLIGIVPETVEEGASSAGTSDVRTTEARVREHLAALFGVRWGATAWFSTYRVHHRVAGRFRDGPFFLVGDAAHVHSPVGAQGMNTGLQDAHGLALAMVDVIRDGAADSTLDRYEAERRPVARRLVATTDRLFGVVTSDRLAPRLVRRLAVLAAGPVLARLVPRLRGASRLFEYVSQVRVHYWMSEDARRAGRRDRVVGRRLSWTGDNFDSLRDARWQVHEYGAVDGSVVAGIGSRLGLPVTVFGPDARRILVPGTFYLVRPDGFVAAAASASDAVSVLGAAMPDGMRPAG